MVLIVEVEEHILMLAHCYVTRTKKMSMSCPPSWSIECYMEETIQYPVAKRPSLNRDVNRVKGFCSAMLRRALRAEMCAPAALCEYVTAEKQRQTNPFCTKHCNYINAHAYPFLAL